jgi:uncharacterized damage-inducible protein DinB
MKTHLFFSYFFDQPWYGKSMTEILNSIDYKIVTQKPYPEAHSILDLVLHIEVWHIFVIKKLDKEDYSIDLNTPQDWIPNEHISEKDWCNLIQSLTNSQNELLKRLKKLSQKDLSTKVPSKYDCDFENMIFGIMQHDIYHLGQIAYLQKWNNSKQ